MRRSTFTVDAESVQGNAGASVTFRPMTVGEMREYRTNDKITDSDELKARVIAWSGIVDDDEHEMPCPADQPDIVDALYLHEQRALMRLLFAGPDVPQPKN